MIAEDLPMTLVNDKRTALSRELWAAAAVREHFRPDALLSDWTARHVNASLEERMRAIETLVELQSVSEAVNEGAKFSPFTLPLAIRQNVLQHVGKQGAAQALSYQSGSLAEQAFASILKSGSVPVENVTRDELVALRTVSPWVSALGLDTGIGDEYLRRRLAETDFLQSMGGPDLHRFVGREALRVTLYEIWKRVPSHRAAVLLEGPGGIGKSTLVTRFIGDLLQHEDDDARPDAVFWLDFDRPFLQTGDVIVFLRELLRQSRRWRPESGWKELDRLIRLVPASRKLRESVDRASRRAHSKLDLSPLVQMWVELFGKAHPRFVVFVDSFEQVQRFDDQAARAAREIVGQLRRAGAHVLDIYASRCFARPDRWPAEEPMQVRRFSVREAEQYLAQEVHRLNLRVSRAQIRSVYNAVGRSPLALRLAVGLIEKEGASFDPVGWGVRAGQSSERVQAELYDRFLLRLRDPNLRKIAQPGLQLRRISEAVIREILVNACQLDLTQTSSGELLEAARREGQLFTRDPADPAVLTHRADVRALMLPNLDADLNPAVRRDINEAAVAYYAKFEDPAARAEELYHRLRLDQPDAQLDARWQDSAGRLLRGIDAELPSNARRYLRARLGGATLLGMTRARGYVGRIDPRETVGFVPELGRPATIPTLPDEGSIANELSEIRRYAQKMLQTGAGSEDLVQLLAHRGWDRVDGPLGDVYAQTMLRWGLASDFLDKADVLLQPSSGAGDAEVRLRVLMTAAAAHEGRGAFEPAKQFWAHALSCAQVLEDPLEELAALIGCARIKRKSPGNDDRRGALLSKAVDLMRASMKRLEQQYVAAREAVAETLEVSLRRPLGESKAIEHLLRQVLRAREAFPSAVGSPSRCAEIGKRIAGIPFESLDELSSVVIRMSLSDQPKVKKLMEVLREEVDWSLRQDLLPKRMW